MRFARPNIRGPAERRMLRLMSQVCEKAAALHLVARASGRGDADTQRLARRDRKALVTLGSREVALLAHDDRPRWFGYAGVRAPRLRFCSNEYPTHELDAAAAITGTGVALLSPTLFASALREGKLVQPFREVIAGPKWHYLLLNPAAPAQAVQGFRAWLEAEPRRCAQTSS